jgi:hypothetical protein
MCLFTLLQAPAFDDDDWNAQSAQLRRDKETGNPRSDDEDIRLLGRFRRRLREVYDNGSISRWVWTRLLRWTGRVVETRMTPCRLVKAAASLRRAVSGGVGAVQ